MTDTVLQIIEPFITFFEGKRYKAYQDDADVWTCGIGHTKDVNALTTVDDNKILEWFKEDLHDADLRVITMVKTNLTDNQYATCLSIGFNLSYNSSVKLFSYLNQDQQLFKNRLLEYCKDAKGHYLKGLKLRRIAERLLFENRDYKVVEPLRNKSVTINQILDKQTELFRN